MNLFDIIVIIILIINIFWILILFKTILKQANIIYKAIEYIEEHYNYENFMYLSDEDTDKLLEILKGDEKNE